MPASTGILDTPLFETTVISDDEDSGKAAAREPAETADPEPAVVPAEVVDLDGETTAAETAAPELAVPAEVVDLGDKPAEIEASAADQPGLVEIEVSADQPDSLELPGRLESFDEIEACADLPGRLESIGEIEACASQPGLAESIQDMIEACTYADEPGLSAGEVIAVDDEMEVPSLLRSEQRRTWKRPGLQFIVFVLHVCSCQ